MAEVGLRLDGELLSRIERARERLAHHTRLRVSRAQVLRECLRLGVAALERSLISETEEKEDSK